jgi:ABC-type multidrug transport system fused ATPase/permease subunit
MRGPGLGLGLRGGGGKGRAGGYEDVPKSEKGEKSEKGAKVESEKIFTYKAFIVILSPFFWPSAGSDGAVMNRIRSTATWLMVALSKVANLLAPLYISAATNDLLVGDFTAAAGSIAIFCSLRFASNLFKEAQAVIFLKVKQQAYIQLAEQTFGHMHQLSLNWHLTKKTGNVIRSMDRGTEAANTLVSLIFLSLGPTLIECVAVCIIFFTSFKSWQLGVLVLGGLFVYITATIIVTQWRKKLREVGAIEIF